MKVQLLWEKAGKMEVVDTVEVDTGAEGRTVPIVLRHTPRSAGEYKVTLRVEPREGELVTTNNEVSTFVTVRARRNQRAVPGRRDADRRRARAGTAVRAGGVGRSPDIVVERRLVNYDPPERGSGGGDSRRPFRRGHPRRCRRARTKPGKLESAGRARAKRAPA